MAADAFIQIRVTQQTKARLRALAERDQIPESTLVRQLIDTMLRTQPQDASAAAAQTLRCGRGNRLSIRLPVEDHMLLESRAAARGLRSATYISHLVRAHLRNLAPLPQNELAALRQSVVELNAIGRNLNQIARVANQSARLGGPSQADLRSMLKVCEALRDHTKALITANLDSWDLGYAQDPC